MAERTLDVWLDGYKIPVGHLISGPGLSISFEYAPGYLGMTGAIPLSVRLPLRPAAFADREARAFFDNLLPEGEPRAAIAAKAGIEAGDVMGLLAILGADAPGAVSVLPAGAPPVKSPGDLLFDYDPIPEGEFEEVIRAVSQGRPPGEQLRFSLAGVQAKLAVARDDEGRFLRPRGGAPTTHIIKVARESGRERGIVANEALCLEVFRRFGIETARAERMTIAGIPCLLVERYDRTRDGGTKIRRLHQEDAAQVLGLDRHLKYEKDAKGAGRDGGFDALFGDFASACQPSVDARDTLFRAAVLNWLLGNSDAHMKNFSLLYMQTRAIGGMQRSPQRRLAPIYDVVSIAVYPDCSHDLAMRIGSSDTWDSVDGNSWKRLAELAYGKRSKSSKKRAIEQIHLLASQILATIDGVVELGVVTRQEAKPIRDVVGQRIRHLNDTMGWTIPADTDAVVSRGGGWTIS